MAILLFLSLPIFRPPPLGRHHTTHSQTHTHTPTHPRKETHNICPKDQLGESVFGVTGCGVTFQRKNDLKADPSLKNHISMATSPKRCKSLGLSSLVSNLFSLPLSASVFQAFSFPGPCLPPGSLDPPPSWGQMLQFQGNCYTAGLKCVLSSRMTFSF